jgi:hypothetical protein
VTVAAAPVPRGGSATRLRDPLVLGIFAGAFLAVILVGVAVVAFRAPPALQGPCGGSPICPPPSSSPRLVNNAQWSSSDLSVSLEYPDGAWTKEAQGTGARSLRLRNGGGAELDLSGTTGSNVGSVFARRVDELKSTYKDLAEHPASDGRQVLGPSIGYVHGGGVGKAFCGTDGSGNPVDAVVMAATNGRTTLVATLLTGNCDVSPIDDDANGDFQAADGVLKTVLWGDT